MIWSKKNATSCLLLTFFMCTFILSYQLEPSYALDSRMIDLYTQKKPYDGKGINQPSDAFAPREEVILYAYVTYNEEPVSNMFVAFEIYGPPNPIENITFSRTPQTSTNGVATVNFTIPWPTENPETIVFGVWRARARVEISGEIVEDTLTFEVGWIVEILSIITVNEKLQPQTEFGKETRVGIKVTLKNIAMLPKPVTLVVAAFDEMKVPIEDLEVYDLEVEPGETYIYVFGVLSIPKWAAIGNAMVNASAYTAPLAEGGVPYCPEVSTIFSITIRDVAIIDVVPSAERVVVGQLVNILVLVENQGIKTETFNVTVYCGSLLVGVRECRALPPNTKRPLLFVWNTSDLPEDDYIISAVASVLPAETDIEDNTRVNGTVAIQLMPTYAVTKELTIITLIVAVAIAVFSIALVMSRRGRHTSSNPSVLLHVDISP